MSTYKKLNKQDAFITTYTAHKHWSVSGSQFRDYGIQVIPSATGVYSSSLAQLYYPHKQSSVIVSHSFDHYTDTTLYLPELRNFNPNSFIISIPRSMTGVNIKPGAEIGFFIYNVQQIRYVVAGYWDEGYTDDPYIFSGVNQIELKDDGEGGLYVSGSNPRYYVGDIVYPHGMIIITDSNYAQLMRNGWNPAGVPVLVPGLDDFAGIPTNTQDSFAIRWQSTHPIFTHNYHCRIRESEYNFTYNPTSLSASLGATYYNDATIYNVSGSINKGDKNNNITGSAFQPYITTVGLYNDANELIAVGKMAQPVPKPANTEMTIIVKIDI
jgi:hypothetical protein